MFHVKHGESRRELLRASSSAIGVELEPSGLDALLTFEGLLREKAVPYGIVSTSDHARLLERHILDSLRAAEAVGPVDRTALDLGSGAGLPGVVVAAAMPPLEVTLVESQRRRVAFLEVVSERLALPNLRISAARVEELPPGTSVDLCFARAFAPPDRAWRVAEPLLAAGGRLVYFAGEDAVVQAPPGARIEARLHSRLEVGGPLVIMAR